MAISELTKNILIYSAVAFVIVALIFLSVILFKVYKIKKTIKKDKMDILNQDSITNAHLKVIQRTDFGEPIFELRDAISNPLDDEIVEFCINTIIKNNFERILMLGNKTSYEIIAISNKSNANIDILSSEFNEAEYNEVLSNEKLNFSHKLSVLKDINKLEKYDAILLLSAKTNWLPTYEMYIDNLREKGMFIIANVTKNKVWKKEIISKISKSNFNYDILNWYKGFILIVK